MDQDRARVGDGVNVVVFGATGMVGAGVLIECLDDPRVESVLADGRRPCGVTHPKLRELIRADLFDDSETIDDFKTLDACFFCLGVSAVGMSEADYHRVTYNLAVATAESLLEVNSCPLSSSSLRNSRKL